MKNFIEWLLQPLAAACASFDNLTLYKKRPNYEAHKSGLCHAKARPPDRLATIFGHCCLCADADRRFVCAHIEQSWSALPVSCEIEHLKRAPSSSHYDDAIFSHPKFWEYIFLWKQIMNETPILQQFPRVCLWLGVIHVNILNVVGSVK